MEKYEFGYRLCIKIEIISWAFLDHHDSHARSKMHDFPIKYFSSNKELLNEPLMDEFKNVVSKNYEIENSNLSISRTSLAFSACQDLDAKKKIDVLPVILLPVKCC